jgi:hypothetical protein
MSEEVLRLLEESENNLAKIRELLKVEKSPASSHKTMIVVNPLALAKQEADSGSKKVSEKFNNFNLLAISIFSLGRRNFIAFNGIW